MAGWRSTHFRWSITRLAGLLTAVATFALPGGASAETGYYQLIQYPQAGFGGFYAQIASAKRSVDMEMYELDDPTAERDLAAAARRGVRVHVLLDSAYHGAEVNRPAYDYLRSHRVPVRWAPAGYIFHIKTTVFDGKTADVSTANLTAKDYLDTRDAELIDSDPIQVAAIQATFIRDWSAAPGGSPSRQTVQAPGLVWSPNTAGAPAQRTMAAVISAAHSSVEFESEELSDPVIYDALAADARRHVSCEVVMTSDSEWDPAFKALLASGCAVHVLPDSAGAIYIHEKAIIIDRGAADEALLLGSQNASWESLNRNRELGLLITGTGGGSAAINAAAAAFASDFSVGRDAPTSPNLRAGFVAPVADRPVRAMRSLPS